MFDSEDLRPVVSQWSWRADNPAPADDVVFNCRKIFLIFIIKTGIAKQAPVYSKESGGCQLCLEEKTFIMYADNSKNSILRKKSPENISIKKQV